MDLLTKNKSLRRGVLRGLFAAEGCIAVKEGYINHIAISYNSKNETENRDFYRGLLEIEGIPTYIRESNSNGQMIIRNWENYYKLWNIGIFNLCHRKRERFIEIMKGMKVGCLLEDSFRRELFKAFNLYQRDIAKILGTYQASVCRMIRGEFLPTIEEMIRASKFLDNEKFNMENMQKNIVKIRIGNLTPIGIFSEDFLSYLFELKQS